MEKQKSVWAKGYLTETGRKRAMGDNISCICMRIPVVMVVIGGPDVDVGEVSGWVESDEVTVVASVDADDARQWEFNLKHLSKPIA